MFHPDWILYVCQYHATTWSLLHWSLAWRLCCNLALLLPAYLTPRRCSRFGFAVSERFSVYSRLVLPSNQVKGRLISVKWSLCQVLVRPMMSPSSLAALWCLQTKYMKQKNLGNLQLKETKTIVGCMPCGKGLSIKELCGCVLVIKWIGCSTLSHAHLLTVGIWADHSWKYGSSFQQFGWGNIFQVRLCPWLVTDCRWMFFTRSKKLVLRTFVPGKRKRLQCLWVSSSHWLLAWWK